MMTFYSLNVFPKTLVLLHYCKIAIKIRQRTLKQYHESNLQTLLRLVIVPIFEFSHLVASVSLDLEQFP